MQPAQHSNPSETAQVESKTDDTSRRELIEKVGKAYFEACKRIAAVVTRLKKKGR
jgi:hypothetical protein